MEGRLDLCSGGNYNSTQEIFVQTRSWWRDPGKYGTFVGPNRISRPGHKSTEGHHSLDVFLLYSCEFIAASTNRHITPNQRYGNRVENQHRKHLDGYSFFYLKIAFHKMFTVLLEGATGKSLSFARTLKLAETLSLLIVPRMTFWVVHHPAAAAAHPTL